MTLITNECNGGPKLYDCNSSNVPKKDELKLIVFEHRAPTANNNL
jgi:hypothetical protein